MNSERHPFWADPGIVTFGLTGLTAQTMGQSREHYSQEIALSIDYAEAANDVGFNTVWSTEHHFSDDGYMPSPWVHLSAIAARVPGLIIATSVAVPGLSDPVRLTEDIMVLDQLSQGRLLLGFGVGYRRIEFAAFGLERSKRAMLLTEAVEAIRSASAHSPIERNGRPPVVITPPSYRPGGPPILLGAFARSGIDRAAAIGDGYLGPDIPLEPLTRRLDWFASQAGTEDKAIVACRSGFVGEKSVATTGIRHVQRLYARWLRDSGDELPATDIGSTETAGGESVPGHTVWGEPEDVCDQLLPLARALIAIPGRRPRHIGVRLTYPGIEPALNIRSIERFGREVIPMIRSRLESNTNHEGANNGD